MNCEKIAPAYRITLAAALVAACSAVAGAAQDTSFTYQGSLSDDGAPVNQLADMRFSLWTAVAGGVQLGDTIEFSGPTAIDVVDGLFTVGLDFGDTPFDGQDVFLEIATRVPAGGGGWTTLTPRQSVTPAPYAIFSMLPWETSGNDIFYDGARVGIGTSNPAFRLDVRSPAPRAIYGWVTNPTGQTFGVYGQSASDEGTGLFGHATANTGMTNGVMGFSDSRTGRGVYGVALDSRGVNYGVYGETRSDDGYAGYFAGRGRFTEDLGIGTGPTARLHVSKAPTDVRPTMIVETQQDMGGGILDRTFIEFVRNDVDAHSLLAGPLALRLNPNTGGEILLGLGGGSVGINTAAPEAKLHVRNSGISLSAAAVEPQADVVIEDRDAMLALYSNSGGTWASGIVLGQVDGNGNHVDKWEMSKRTGGELRFLYGTDPGHATADWVLRLNPDGRTIVRILEIVGADLAERFPATEHAEPGMIMAIDPEHAGKLRVSRGAYNRRVAGIVSGAGDMPVGAILGNLPGSEDSPAIALSGRVWVHCDASLKAVQLGDFLTTAERPGYAMPVVDRVRAEGAIVGKAMTALSHGERGMVLVLVNLQ